MIIGISGKIGSGKDTIANIIIGLAFGYNNVEILNMVKNNFMLHPRNNAEGWQIKKFAGKLKEIVSTLINCSLEDLEDQEFKNTPLGSEWSIWRVKNEFSQITIPNKIFLNEEEVRKFCDEASNSQHHYTYWEDKLTPRKLLQLIGTECGREIVHPNIWINSLFSEYKNVHNFTEKVLNRGLREGDNNYLKGKKPNWIITDVRFENEARAIKQRDGILIRVNRPTLNINNINSFEHPSETSLDNYDKFNYIVDNDGSIEELVEKVKQILIKEKII